MLPAGAWAITVINAFNRLGSAAANPLKVDISTKLRGGGPAVTGAVRQRRG